MDKTVLPPLETEADSAEFEKNGSIGSGKLQLSIAGLRFRFQLERPIYLDPAFRPYLVSDEGEPDMDIQVSWDWARAELPASEPVGRDNFLDFYREKQYRFCITPGHEHGPISCTRYDDTCESVSVWINPETSRNQHNRLSLIYRMLPFRQLFLRKKILLIHSSQIRYTDYGVVFAAPSGTGKTTQSRLWARHRGAEILCNDRTLIRKEGTGWVTYGYPLDGSEPIRTTERAKLCALVLPEQAGVNAVTQLTPGKAAKKLMEQAVIDVWDPDSRQRALELILNILAEIPAYRLQCTISEDAVTALENAIRKEVNGFGRCS